MKSIEEQLQEAVARIATLEKANGTGLGAGSSGLGAGSKGLGWGPDRLTAQVYEMLAVGSPRLALAVAMGLPIIPYQFAVVGTFVNQGTTLVPDAGNDVKIVQDTVIDSVDFQVQSGITPQGLDSLTNWFFQYQSGIQAKLKVVSGSQGQAGYQVIPNFTPINLIPNIVDKYFNDQKWLLSYTNGIVMDFNASVPLPFAPVTVTFTFSGRTSYDQKLLDTRNSEAVKKLEQMGYNCADSRQYMA